jgi:hypothetical protein
MCSFGVASRNLRGLREVPAHPSPYTKELLYFHVLSAPGLTWSQGRADLWALHASGHVSCVFSALCFQLCPCQHEAWLSPDPIGTVTSTQNNHVHGTGWETEANTGEGLGLCHIAASQKALLFGSQEEECATKPEVNIRPINQAVDSKIKQTPESIEYRWSISSDCLLQTANTKYWLPKPQANK